MFNDTIGFIELRGKICVSAAAVGLYTEKGAWSGEMAHTLQSGLPLNAVVTACKSTFIERIQWVGSLPPMTNQT